MKLRDLISDINRERAEIIETIERHSDEISRKCRLALRQESNQRRIRRLRPIDGHTEIHIATLGHTDLRLCVAMITPDDNYALGISASLDGDSLTPMFIRAGISYASLADTAASSSFCGEDLPAAVDNQLIDYISTFIQPIYIR